MAALKKMTAKTRRRIMTFCSNCLWKQDLRMKTSENHSILWKENWVH